MGNDPVQHFRDLRVWREGHSLVLLIYRLTKQFPTEEQYGLSNQSRRVAVSVTSNIAEGFGRATARDKRHFYMTAKASLAEIQNQMLVARDLGYITESEWASVEAQSIVSDKLLTNFIRSAVDKSS